MLTGGSPAPAAAIRWRRQNGQAAVELALLIPIVFLILIGVLEFGRLITTHLIVQHAAREAARLAVTGATDQTVEARAREILEGGLVGAGDAAVTVDPSGQPRYPGDDVSVTVTYDLALVNPVITAAGLQTWRLRAAYLVRVE